MHVTFFCRGEVILSSAEPRPRLAIRNVPSLGDTPKTSPCRISPRNHKLLQGCHWLGMGHSTAQLPQARQTKKRHVEADADLWRKEQTHCSVQQQQQQQQQQQIAVVNLFILSQRWDFSSPPSSIWPFLLGEEIRLMHPPQRHTRYLPRYLPTF
jgi:hypothetical protein